MQQVGHLLRPAHLRHWLELDTHLRRRRRLLCGCCTLPRVLLACLYGMRKPGRRLESRLGDVYESVCRVHVLSIGVAVKVCVCGGGRRRSAWGRGSHHSSQPEPTASGQESSMVRRGSSAATRVEKRVWC